MRRSNLGAPCLALALLAAPASADPAAHEVQRGETLSGIARRHDVPLRALQRANGLGRGAVIREGQRLWIPPADDTTGERTATERAAREREARETARAEREDPGSARMGTLAVPGSSAPAYYFEPTGPGRRSLRPVIVYLHGRGGRPASDCQRWAPVARPFGWLLCPSGQEDRGGGQRGWSNDWYAGQRVVLNALTALREKFGGRVQLRGNTLVGFSEGTYVAMNVAVRNPTTFNRWLFFAADADYWGGPGTLALNDARARVRAAYLVTGEQDVVVESTRQVRERLERAGVRVKASLPADMGHEVPLERRAPLIRAALDWLVRGDQPSRAPTRNRPAPRPRAAPPAAGRSASR